MKTTFKVLGYVYHAGVLFLVFCCCTILADHIETKDRHEAKMAKLVSKLDELTAQADLNNTGLVVVQSQILELIEGVNFNVAHGDAAITRLQQRIEALETGIPEKAPHQAAASQVIDALPFGATHARKEPQLRATVKTQLPDLD